MKIYKLLSLMIFGTESGTKGNPAIPEIKSGYEQKHIYRELRIIIKRNADEYFREFTYTPLKVFLPGTEKISGVETTKTITNKKFPEAGSVRQVILKNGDYAREEVVELQDRYLRYKVTEYTIQQAKPLEYGMGEFWFEPVSKNTTSIRWKYSFKLKENTFPGNLGYIGRVLFKKVFVDGGWAEYMNSSIYAIKTHAEGN